MRRKFRFPDATCALLISCLVALLISDSYSLNAVVTDKDQFETPVQKIKLADCSYLKVYHGGVIQQIPLKQVQLVKFDPSSSQLFESELYYSAELVLKNGAKIQSSKDKTKRYPVFVSVQNTLVGKSKLQQFSITLDNVLQIQIKK